MNRTRSRSTVLGPLRILLLGLLASLVALSAPAVAVAQSAVAPGSVTSLALRLRALDGVKRVLMIGAHPDDEDTSLLTALARGAGAETAYLSLTRGDGGQNLIGPELFEGLGVVRTGELLAARELDGGRQFFTRAFDYGYSKSADEALSKWPREELLRDVTWVVRSFRPHVVISVFSGTPRDGHGQHQAAGIMAREVFDAAADPERFPEQLEEGVQSWQIEKLYRRVRGLPEQEIVEVETGRFDPLLGRSWFQVAMDSRSQHRSQDMGMPQPLGGRESNLTLWAAAPEVAGTGAGASGDGPEGAGGLFAGIDTALVGLADDVPAEARSRVRTHLEAYRAELDRARRSLSALDPWGTAPILAGALRELDAALTAARAGGAGMGPPMGVLENRRAAVARALLEAAGVVVRVAAGDDLVVPGDDVEVEVEVWNGGPFRLEQVAPELATPGWTTARFTPNAAGDEGDASEGSRYDGAGGDGALEAGEVARFRFSVAVPADAEPSRLYFRESERDGAMYRWPDDPTLRGRPFDPPPIRGLVQLAVDFGEVRTDRLVVDREVRYVGVDKAVGEFTEPLLIVPAVSVAAQPAVTLWPAELSTTREVAVEVRAEDADGVSGTLRLEAPEGWRVEPASHPLAFGGPGESRTFGFRVTKDGAPPGRHTLTPVAELDDGRTYREGYDLIEYPHIRRVAFFEPAEIQVTVAPVAMPDDLTVGYVMGSGDDGPEALRQMGVDVEMVDAARLQAGDLEGIDALVLGIRVYETRPEIAAANDAILDFARQGGTVVVQYNKYEFPEGGYAPYPVSMRPRAPRVTDEESPVRILDPDSPLFAAPNRITEADFDGWVQERGLYFLSEYDERYVPQIAFSDPGEDEALGSLLVAPVGEGLYVYTGISFFRQFPAGVAGGYRLFANLIALDRERWDAWTEGR